MKYYAFKLGILTMKTQDNTNNLKTVFFPYILVNKLKIATINNSGELLLLV